MDHSYLNYDETLAVQESAHEKDPRDKLISAGPASLSDQELLAIILNGGIRNKLSSTATQELLDHLDQEKGIPAVKDLSLFPGMGTLKACAIVAMLELGRRRFAAAGKRITQPQDIYPLIRHHANRRQERFICLSLNGAHEVLAIRLVTIGLVNRTIVHPREVFADPLLDRATAVVVAHNHPSGQLTPSNEDDEITTRLKAAAEILGLHLLDHLIFSETTYLSYRQTGRLFS
ncbi:MAG: DNA repair protein RadC [Spirochaetaceae bacterium]|jgi:DNA repair protein RadC|nr:DNA repair protein RadC [Spirochaetaceae bacterium]